VIQPVNEELKDDLIVYWQRDCLFFGLSEISRECCLKKVRMIDEEILMYDETLLLGAD
jgi:hypothetical protein